MKISKIKVSKILKFTKINTQIILLDIASTYQKQQNDDG